MKNRSLYRLSLYAMTLALLIACAKREEPRSTHLAAVNADLQKASKRFREGSLSGRDYLPEDIPLPAGRNDLRWMFSLAEPVQWRVRAVNGAQAMSSWSQVRTQGPASGGVDPGP